MCFAYRYYKKFGIPDMDRIGMKLDSRSLNFAHANNTLVIQVFRKNEKDKWHPSIFSS